LTAVLPLAVVELVALVLVVDDGAGE